jgi:predicted metal-dependent phosphoesterase TrpH
MPTITLAPDDPIDLQLHTSNSDGTWTAEALIDHAVAMGFALIAVADHDRLDTVAAVQRYGAERGLPVIAASELSAIWQGEPLDLLCYGFDPHHPGPLGELAAATRRAQLTNYEEVYATLLRQGYRFAQPESASNANEGQFTRLEDFTIPLTQQGYGEQLGAILRGAGFQWVTADPAQVLNAARRSGAICVIAHPGRGNGFFRFNVAELERFHAQFPVDGLEAHYPLHSAEQVALFCAYAERQNLVAGAGSDSHGPDGRLPIKYPASAARALLERLGVRVG